MNDTHKLLEMAAKAMGRKIPTPRQYPWAWINDGGIHENISEDGSRVKTWAPHTDDGDNSRMRTKLRINVFWSDTAIHCANAFGDAYELLANHESPDAALRICALRCAAMMGERM